MAKTNVKPPSLKTHEGGVAKRITVEQALRRSVMACLLWEDSFYEDGVSIAERIASLVPDVSPPVVAQMAKDARTKFKLRHVPLLLAREMARHKTHRSLVEDVLADVIQRADELAEYCAIYMKEKKQPLSAASKRGLARAFNKFTEYDLAKYNRDGAFKLRDVLFLCHAKPKDAEQEALWKKLIEGTLQVPDTWEVALSAGADKKETFTRLISEKKLGALALLRNLRNMQDAGVPATVIRSALESMRVDRVLPYRFIAAARYAPNLEPDLEAAMFKCVELQEKLKGETALLIDVSGSMDAPISNKSDLSRMDAACALGILLREICDVVRVFTFSEWLIEVPNRRGFALRDAIVQSQPHGGTYLGSAVRLLHGEKLPESRETWGSMGFQRNHPSFVGKKKPAGDYSGGAFNYDRLVILTDEQSHDKVPDPKGKGYVINVAAYQNGVGYGPWNHIDGWSEAVVQYIQELERVLM